MDSSVRSLFDTFSQDIVSYLPKLLGALVLLGVGWLLGWFAKRLVVRLCAIFHMERLARRFRWGKDFSKADIRYAMFNTIGNVVFVVVFLVFVQAALVSMQLTVLSNLLEKSVLFIPKLVTALLIFGIGWVISNWVSVAIYRNLTKEGLPRVRLISRFAKFVLMLFFSAMALTQLDIAREVVIIGFAVLMAVLGALAIVFVAVAGKSSLKDFMDKFHEE
ncbi:MAG: hypothetical protein V1784_01900 [bacterium]